MKQKRNRRIFQCASLLIAFVLLTSIVAAFPASALEGYTKGRLWMASEPGEISPYVHYYSAGQEKKQEDIVWEDKGYSGKAISLSGNGDVLEIEYRQLQMHTMTVAGWFYWRGAVQGQEESTQYKQRLFTLSHSDDVWLSVMPHAKDPERKDESGKVMDGVYMGFEMGQGKSKTHIDLWNPASPGKETYGLPLNEWHHVAMTMDGKSLKLYIDGSLWFERMLILGVEEMRNNMLTIGGGRWGDPTLNALIDNLAVYDFAMTSEQIAMLDAGVDPLAEGAVMPTTTEPSYPTAPSETQPTTEETILQENADTLWGLPTWTVVLIVGILIVFAALSVFLSFYQPPAPPPKTKTTKKDGSDQGGASR